MLSAVGPVRSLLLAVFMLMAGSGFLATLLSIRLEAMGVAPLLIGSVATAYFAGLTIGSMRVFALVQRVGHIRAFTAFLSLYSASALSYAIIDEPIVWAGLRFVEGFCMAGIFVCVESWLNDRADSKSRGSVLSAYMIALYLGQAAGQFLLNVSDARPSAPFLAASILLSLAVLPIALTRMRAPTLENARPMPIFDLYRASPVGIVGAIATGVMLGAFYGLGGVYARGMGLALSDTALFMSAVILGGVLLQWPIGRLSDLIDRRKVIAGTMALTLAVSVWLVLIEGNSAILLLAGALFGGFSFSLYPLCVAHSNDHLAEKDRVSASGGLVLAYSVGAAAGPLLGAGAVGLFGAPGLFMLVGLVALLALGFAIRRMLVAAPVPAPLQGDFQMLPRTAPTAALLDADRTDER